MGGEYKRSLEELWAIMRNGEPCQMISSKPFRPSKLHAIVAQLAPHFYTEQQLLQLNNFSNQQTTTKNDLIHKRRHQEIADKDEMAKQVTKKTRTILIVSNNVAPPLPHPDLPITFMNRIRELNGTDLKFLMAKQLYNSDIRRTNNRLSMPKNDMNCDFLMEDEMGMLDKREGSKGRLHGVEVTLLDPCLREYTLELKKWETNSIVYNLVKDWKRVVADNKLQPGQKFEIWSFRVDKRLYFLLNKM